MFGSSRRAITISGLGIDENEYGTEWMRALINLTLATGNVGNPGTGVLCLRGQNNVQGACDMGCLPNFYPGYQPVTDFEVREKFESAWGGSLNTKPGLPLTEMFHAILEGKIKALYIAGENPMLSEPDITHVEEALRQRSSDRQDIFPMRRPTGPCRFCLPQPSLKEDLYKHRAPYQLFRKA
jgi:predicted molibdopterin-dependent oxidoreductase YjgC